MIEMSSTFLLDVPHYLNKLLLRFSVTLVYR